MDGRRHAHLLFVNSGKVAQGVETAFFGAFTDVILLAGQESARVVAPHEVNILHQALACHFLKGVADIGTTERDGTADSVHGDGLDRKSVV